MCLARLLLIVVEECLPVQQSKGIRLGLGFNTVVLHLCLLQDAQICKFTIYTITFVCLFVCFNNHILHRILPDDKFSGILEPPYQHIICELHLW